MRNSPRNLTYDMYYYITVVIRFLVLTQLFFFFFLASWSFMLPILDMLVRLLRLEMLSHEFWR